MAIKLTSGLILACALSLCASVQAFAPGTPMPLLFGATAFRPVHVDGLARRFEPYLQKEEYRRALPRCLIVKTDCLNIGISGPINDCDRGKE